jgi:acyl-CoA reductase-like NAD-dependent aldehyde dehydrogenase
VEDRPALRGGQHRRAEAGRAGAALLPAPRRALRRGRRARGVFNVVNGLGEQAGKALALHNDVRKITFTARPRSAS